MARKSRGKRSRESANCEAPSDKDDSLLSPDGSSGVAPVEESDGSSRDSLELCVKRGKKCEEHDTKGALEAIRGLEKSRCSECQARARWLCLVCKKTLCTKNKAADHVTSHLKDSDHRVYVHLSKARVMCLACDIELHVDEIKDQSRDQRSDETMDMDESSIPSASSTVKAAAKPLKKMSSVDTRGNAVEPYALQSRPIMSNIEDEDDDIRPKGLSGLYNMGNTCYANAAIQALVNCPPFSDYFRRKHSLAAYAGGGLVSGQGNAPFVSHALLQLIQRMWSPSRIPVIAPDNLLHYIRNKCPQFSGYAQQDSQEFIRCLLELVHRELARPVYAHEDAAASAWKRKRMNNNRPVESTQSPRWRRRSSSSTTGEREGDSGWSSDGDAAMVGEEEINWKPVRQRSVVSDVFDGSMESAVRCLTCNNVSTVTETFADLSLQIASPPQNTPTIDDEEVLGDSDTWLWSWTRWFTSLSSWFVAPAVSLEDCFAAFFTPDRLIGDDMYSCEKCSKLRNGVKTYRVTKLPEVLCVHLKRFHHDQLAGESKVNTRVTFPLAGLDLSKWATETAGESEYELCALVCHEGANADSGHYVAIARNEIDGNWYEFDDSTVTKLDAAYVLTKDAYVLFYQKKQDLRQERVRDVVRQMMSPQAIASSPANDRHYISTEWLERLSTFAEPGPITNYDFLCPHANLLPRRSEHVTVICTAVPTKLWRYLNQTFGGGPSVSQLHYCAVCDGRAKSLVEKRKREADNFRQLERTMHAAEDRSPALLYAHHIEAPSCLSKTWFGDWEKFINDPGVEPPGPIDNSHLLIKSPEGKARLRPRAHCLRVPREFYLYFQALYGGGPEVFYIDTDQPSEEKAAEIVRMADLAIAAERQRLQQEDAAAAASKDGSDEE
ncbi:hypothetical protein PMAYCL1PPCAC_01221 [Pristionchus mayeri]|uniref:Ubiquitin carboxyl-terminal hydrolase n=1 Tax=Pristionchus mayeri TaxID=1317129 RepID=A0AAN5C769_9BILA|nr:hypothetical protein PMAYCL1PPCAC_01221 [Pristionchus mayeri]